MREYPIDREIIYPEEIIGNLEKVISENNFISNNIYENQKQMDRLSNAIQPVFEIRDKGLSLEDAEEPQDIRPGTSTIIVRLDPRAERLISKYFNLYRRLLNKMLEDYK